MSSDLLGRQPTPLLLVVANKGLRGTLRLALTREGFAVRTTPNAEQALSLLREEARPSAVIFDLGDADGEHLKSALDGQPELATIPQLAFGAVTEHAPHRAYLQVPISFTEIIEHLRRITTYLN